MVCGRRRLDRPAASTWRAPGYIRRNETRDCADPQSHRSTPTALWYNGLELASFDGNRLGVSAMNVGDFVIPPGQGAVWQMAPGRSAALKITSEMTQSVMMFEEVAPTDTVTDLHVHHDSDEI